MKKNVICKRALAVLCCMAMLLSTFIGAATVSAASAVDQIGLVSYRDSVLQDIEAAEAVYDTLSDSDKAIVDAARLEYDRLALLARDMQKVLDFPIAQGAWANDGSTIAVAEATGTARTGNHLTITTTGAWSIWSVELSAAMPSVSFDNLAFGADIKRVGGADNFIQFDIGNAAGQTMTGNRWYGEYGGVDGEWAMFTMPLKNTQNPTDWSTWTASTWNAASPIASVALRQVNNPAATVEIASLGLYDTSIDNVTPVTQANAVIDQIAALTASSSSEDQLAVRTAYNALSDAAKQFVVNADALNDLPADSSDAAQVVAAIESIGMVSYRASVLAAIEQAEAMYAALDTDAKGQVTNKDDLDAARAEYDELDAISKRLQIIWEADTANLEGFQFDGGDLQLEDTGDMGEHEGEHWVLYTTGDKWSLWTGVELNVSEYDFNKIKMGVSLRRSDTNEDADGFFTMEVRNDAGQIAMVSRWYAEMGAANGEWTTVEEYLSAFEDPNAGIDPWPTWNEDTFNMGANLTLIRLSQDQMAAEIIEIDRVVLYNEGVDKEALVAEANEVVDMIEAIGEITSADQEDVVDAAQEAYDALTDTQRELVVNGYKLKNMSLAVRKLKTVDNVIKAIDKIKEITEDNFEEAKEPVFAAREAFDNYMEKYDDQAAITNLDKLLAAEEALETFLAAERAEAVAEVEEIIDAIGTVDASEECEFRILEAEAALEDLVKDYGSTAKDEVKNLQTLLDARKAFDKLLENPATYTPGDANKDGKVDAGDALTALQHAVKLITLEGDAFAAADVNHSQSVDASDALMILQYTVKLIDKFPEA